MADQISPRAQAILDEIERESGVHGSAPSAPSRSAASVPPASGGGELNRLVADVLDQTERARLRLAALSDAIEDIAGRLGSPLEVPTALLQRDGSEDAPEPTDAETIQLPTSEVSRPAIVPSPPMLVPHDRPSPASAGDGCGPRVPVEEQVQVLDTLLSHQTAAALPPPPPTVAPPPPPPARAVLIGAPPPPAGRSHETGSTPPPLAYSTMGSGPHPPAPRPQAPPPQEAAPAPAGAAPAINDSARLIAVEMAVSGFTRDEVGQRLRSMYGIPQPEGTLDAVFGTGSSGTSRVTLS